MMDSKKRRHISPLFSFLQIHARKMTMMMSDDVQLYNLPTTMFIVMGRYDQSTLLRLNNNDRR